MDVDKLKKRLHFYGAVASIITLLSYMIDKFDVLTKMIGINILPSSFFIFIFWIGLIFFVVLNFIAWGISRFPKDEGFKVVKATFILTCLDDTGEVVDFYRERIIKPKKTFNVINEGLHFSDGQIATPESELWIASKKKGDFEKDRNLNLRAIYEDLEDPDRRSKICQFHFDAPLERKNYYIHTLKYKLNNSFKGEKEYFKVNIVLSTDKIIFKLIPHKNRLIDDKSANVVKLKAKGFLNPKFLEENGIRFEENNLIWEKSNPEIGDEYQVNWKWGTNQIV